MPQRTLLILALLVGVTSCVSDLDEPLPDATETPAVAPWDAGFERSWFFTRKRDLDDPLWQRVTRLVGQPQPPLSVTDWRGEPLDAADLEGKVVLVDFWATWCPDCRAAAPVVDALVERLADEPFAIVSICAEKGGERYDEARETWGLELVTALDADGQTEAAFDVLRWPYHVLVDTDGTVRAAGLVTEHLDEAVDLLIAQERARGALR